MLLSVENVTQRFGELAAVNDLTFDVKQGEIFGIAGPNGAGKTTVFNLISGFLHGSGRILLDGKRIDGLSPGRVARLGVARTFQVPHPFDSMTVVQNLQIGEHFGGRGGAVAHRRPWGDLRELLAFIGLEGKEDRPVPGLKLFDKKLTVLGAALATQPRLVMLDEAIGGLSVLEADQSLDLFRRLNKEWGITIIMIEHLMSALTRLCDRLLILNNGEALRVGEPHAVVEDPTVQEVLVGVKHA